MLKIIEEVARQRISKKIDNYQIQLSSVFIDKYIDEMNDKFDMNIKKNKIMHNIKHIIDGKEFIIRNRAYRDDTNDNDVEEIIYKLLKL